MLRRLIPGVVPPLVVGGCKTLIEMSSLIKTHIFNPTGLLTGGCGPIPGVGPLPPPTIPSTPLDSVPTQLQIETGSQGNTSE